MEDYLLSQPADHEPVLAQRIQIYLPARRFEPVRFAARRTRAYVVRAQVYGVNGTPRARWRHDSQLTAKPMRTDRYERIV